MRKEESLALIKGLFQFDPLPVGPDRGPALIVSPQGDPADLHRQMPEVPFPTITAASHWMQLDRPDEFNRLLDDFLARIQP